NIITKRAGGQDLSQYERVIHWKPQKGLNVGIGVDAQGQQHELYRYTSGGSSLLKTAVMGTLAVLGGMAASSIIGGAFAGGAGGSAAAGSTAAGLSPLEMQIAAETMPWSMTNVLANTNALAFGPPLTAAEFAGAGAGGFLS